ncbi:GNAT family N-acetyltransferase [Iodobacter sp. LRB]|uniref:GNAT family N-acetyltransferase n=1 Tax=unclassified Iodobacter TaxID=235634 RepID=UPI000C0D1029|nr:GNAT family N-acetyltransferase [Iodobacter sp. BJB302]PHV01443.1 GNAT family N-acetyltransferase [Iodobacter sp. BJB302]
MTTFEKVKLQTSRLILRPLQETDAAALLAIFSDEKVMQYWSTPPWDSIEIAEALIARDLKAMAAGDYIRLGIEREEDRVLIGNCTLFDLDKQCRRAEIGYGMAHSAWGKGYMHEALSALLDFGFTQLNLNRVEADIDPRNMASAKSLERLGFSREGYLRERWIVDGVVSDTALYGLLVSDWHDRLKLGPQ